MTKLLTYKCKKCNKEFQKYIHKLHSTHPTYCSRLCTNNRNGTPIERFFKFISAQSHPNDCWEWLGVKSHQGYGNFTFNNHPVRAHRFSWELHGGTIPEGLLVCHHCDNPSCVNPLHLYVGTHVDNNNDTIKRGRNIDRKGSKHPCSVVTEKIALEIRSKSKQGQTGQELSREYGLCEATISNIKNRKSWTHI
jgi:hypothetical protein